MAGFLSTNLNKIINRTTDISSGIQKSNLVKQPKFKTNNLKTILTRTSTPKTSETDHEDTIIKQPDFKKHNLKTILNRNNEEALESNDSNVETADDELDDEVTFNTELSKDLNWAQELEDRINFNKQVIGQKKKTQSALEQEFWNDYFSTLWSKKEAPFLNALGANFKLDVLNWGFNESDNAIIAFLLQDEVRSRLLKTKLLTNKNYVVLHNAVLGGSGKRLLSDSQLRKTNIYNIIYNPAWYKYSPKIMYEYLKYQAKLISPLGKTPTGKDRIKNRRLLLLNKDKQKIAKSTKQYCEEILKVADNKVPKLSLANNVSIPLNSLDVVKNIASLLGLQISDNSNNQNQQKNKIKTDTKQLANLIKSEADVRYSIKQLFDLSRDPNLATFSKKFNLKAYDNMETSDKFITNFKEFFVKKDPKISYKLLVSILTKKFFTNNKG